MKFLTVYRSRLEIARKQLRKPLLVIGRSPTCDIVLRAEGVRPIHFIVEWIGSGVFNPDVGSWSIVDVSIAADDAEGLVLTKEAVSVAGFSFRLEEGSFESSEVIGGKIVDDMATKKFQQPDILEFVQVRTDSGAIEEVLHFPLQVDGVNVDIQSTVQSIKIESPKRRSDGLINIGLDQMPDSEVFLAGRKVANHQVISLKAADFAQIKWNGRDFYLRFVDEIISPPIARDFWGDPLLKKLTAAVAIFLLLLIFLVKEIPKAPEPEKEPQRIARVEVPAPPPPPVAQPVTPPPPPVATNIAKSVPNLAQTQKGASQVAAARAPKEPKAKVQAGLNSPAKVTNVNQVGILGALSQNVKKGKGVKADQIVNQGIINQSVTANDSARIVLKNPPAGVLGSGDGGSAKGTSPQNLGAASTTLSGVSKYDAKSIGPIARNGGKSGYQIGTGNTNNGVGGGKGATLSTGGIGKMDADDFTVQGGGLDRDTVRKIIASYRGQIRTCYERALISNSSLQGRIVYKWNIDPQGSVVVAQIVKNSVESPNLKTCVLEVIQQMTFPKAPNGRPTTVIYPFVFQGKN